MSDDTKRADDLIREALDAALNRWRGIGDGHRHHVDANLVDAFTSYLLDAGVDADRFDHVLADAHRDREYSRTRGREVAR